MLFFLADLALGHHSDFLNLVGGVASLGGCRLPTGRVSRKERKPGNRGQTLVDCGSESDSSFMSESRSNSCIVSILMEMFGRWKFRLLHQHLIAIRRSMKDERRTLEAIENAKLFGRNSRTERDMFSVLCTPSAAPRIILRALSVARRELEYTITIAITLL